MKEETKGEDRPFGRRRRGHEKEEVRRLILHTAEGLFVETGYHAFSMRRLAEKLQYSPAALYLYFRNKDELLFTVVDQALRTFREELEAAVVGVQEPLQRIERLGEAYLRFGFQHPAAYQLMFMWRIDYLIGCAQEEELPRLSAFEVLTDTVQDAKDSGAIRTDDVQACADWLWATMHGVVALGIQMPWFGEERLVRLLEQVKEKISLGLQQNENRVWGRSL